MDNAAVAALAAMAQADPKNPDDLLEGFIPGDRFNGKPLPDDKIFSDCEDNDPLDLFVVPASQRRRMCQWGRAEPTEFEKLLRNEKKMAAEERKRELMEIDREVVATKAQAAKKVESGEEKAEGGEGAVEEKVEMGDAEKLVEEENAGGGNQTETDKKLEELTARKIELAQLANLTTRKAELLAEEESLKKSTLLERWEALKRQHGVPLQRIVDEPGATISFRQQRMVEKGKGDWVEKLPDKGTKGDLLGKGVDFSKGGNLFGKGDSKGDNFRGDPGKGDLSGGMAKSSLFGSANSMGGPPRGRSRSPRGLRTSSKDQHLGKGSSFDHKPDFSKAPPGFLPEGQGSGKWSPEMCSDGNDCPKAWCFFSHPPERAIPQSDCRLPCRFAHNCDREDCFFVHPPNRDFVMKRRKMKKGEDVGDFGELQMGDTISAPPAGAVGATHGKGWVMKGSKVTGYHDENEDPLLKAARENLPKNLGAPPGKGEVAPGNMVKGAASGKGALPPIIGAGVPAPGTGINKGQLLLGAAGAAGMMAASGAGHQHQNMQYGAAGGTWTEDYAAILAGGLHGQHGGQKLMGGKGAGVPADHSSATAAALQQQKFLLEQQTNQAMLALKQSQQAAASAAMQQQLTGGMGVPSFDAGQLLQHQQQQQQQQLHSQLLKNMQMLQQQTLLLGQQLQTPGAAPKHPDHHHHSTTAGVVPPPPPAEAPSVMGGPRGAAGSSLFSSTRSGGPTSSAAPGFSSTTRSSSHGAGATRTTQRDGGRASNNMLPSHSGEAGAHEIAMHLSSSQRDGLDAGAPSPPEGEIVDASVGKSAMQLILEAERQAGTSNSEEDGKNKNPVSQAQHIAQIASANADAAGKHSAELQQQQLLKQQREVELERKRQEQELKRQEEQRKRQEEQRKREQEQRAREEDRRRRVEDQERIRREREEKVRLEREQREQRAARMQQSHGMPERAPALPPAPPPPPPPPSSGGAGGDDGAGADLMEQVRAAQAHLAKLQGQMVMQQQGGGGTSAGARAGAGQQDAVAGAGGAGGQQDHAQQQALLQQQMLQQHYLQQHMMQQQLLYGQAAAQQSQHGASSEQSGATTTSAEQQINELQRLQTLLHAHQQAQSGQQGQRAAGQQTGAAQQQSSAQQAGASSAAQQAQQAQQLQMLQLQQMQAAAMQMQAQQGGGGGQQAQQQQGTAAAAQKAAAGAHATTTSTTQQQEQGAAAQQAAQQQAAQQQAAMAALLQQQQAGGNLAALMGMAQQQTTAQQAAAQQQAGGQSAGAGAQQLALMQNLLQMQAFAAQQQQGQ